MKINIFQRSILLILIFNSLTIHAQSIKVTQLIEAVKTNDRSKAEELLALEPDINAKDSLGLNPLHYAVFYKNIEMTKILLQEGADVNAISIGDFTPLLIASGRDDIEIVKTLLRAGADVKAREKQQNSSLHFASDNGSTEIVKALLLAGADVNARSANSMTPLHLAVAGNGDIETMKALLLAGADVNAAEEIKMTPLHSAVFKGKNDMVQSLLLAGANVNSRNIKKETPLHYAAYHENYEITKTLLMAGAEVSAEDVDHNTPMDHAKKNGNKEIQTILKKYGGGLTESVSDIDGNVYNTITIGDQVWMDKNLATTTYNDGTPIMNVTGNDAWANLNTGAYCWYENKKVKYGNTFGALYNWHAVETGKLCPAGWHVPTLAEWETLIGFLGGEDVAGAKLETAGPDFWGGRNASSTNELGFSAIPGGVRSYTGSFNFIHINCEWWSATRTDTDNAWTYNPESIFYFLKSKNDGLSIRCVKD